MSVVFSKQFPEQFHAKGRLASGWGEGFLYYASFFFKKSVHFQNSSTTSVILVLILQGPHCNSSPRKHTRSQKTKSLSESTWRELLTCWAHIWLLSGKRKVPCLFLKCLGNCVCAAIWYHTPLPVFQISFFFFFRPSIVIKSRGEIRVWKFNYLHMLRTKTSILDVPIFITWTHLGCLFLLLHQIIAVDVHTENATSSRQEVCDMVTVPICGNSNWQRNTHYNSLKIASNI